ncbi:hypothetical protein [Spiroplasma kunkelii]|nr:hypothetical protein [Spiroplasma kunkelii]
MKIKQYFILWSLVKKYGKDNIKRRWITMYKLIKFLTIVFLKMNTI